MLLEILQTEMMAYFSEKLEKEGRWNAIIDALGKGQSDPYSVVKEIMATEFNHPQP